MMNKKSLTEVQEEHGSSCDCYEEEAFDGVVVVLGNRCKKRYHQNLVELKKKVKA